MLTAYSARITLNTPNNNAKPKKNTVTNMWKIIVADASVAERPWASALWPQ
jgi:hypothetical protein